ncbi:MAG: hypothetical protein HOH07_03255 [Euryarchaeota archaeon]|jgi:hypothetical protein|nr:hypothetical protein [Euryarchaeota archaeon]|tara:strand:+ start:292 stop:489 length:198 start_codon:yes stop_codon:yes gene_type:complete
MEFVNEINEKEESVKVDSNSLEIGYIKYTSEDISFEIKDVKVKDVQGLREFLWEIIDEIDSKEGR